MTDAKLLPGFEERFADVKAVRLRYFVGGPADAARPPLVLVHGLSGSATNWTLVAPELARERRVLVPDLPGHAGSAPLPAAPTLEPYAERVALLAEREGMLPGLVVGHSLGGLVAIRLALRRPDGIRGLVLCAAAGITSSTRLAERVLAVAGFLRPSRRVAPHRSLVARTALLRRAVFGHWGAADAAALEPRAVEGLLAGAARHTDTNSAWRALCGDDPRRDLDRVRCPCLVLWGAEDNQLPLADGYDYARRLRAPLRVIADCGHLLIVERPTACLDAIQDFAATIGS